MKKLFTIAAVLSCLTIVTSLSAPTGYTSSHVEDLSKDSIITRLRMGNDKRLEVIEEKSKKITNEIINSRGDK